MESHLTKCQLSAKYDELCSQAKEIILRVNPCKIEVDIEKGTVSCVSSRAGRERSGELCCEGCKHLTKLGCGEQSLACLLWLCHTVSVTPAGRRALSLLRAVEMAAHMAGVPMRYRASKRENFRDISKEGLVQIQ